jgi:hypothetical protein
MSDECLTESDLEEAKRVATRDLAGNLDQQAAALQTLQLVREIRRLSQFVIDAEPYLPDEQTRTIHLPARPEAQVESNWR